jgi:hypothetical protein
LTVSCTRSGAHQAAGEELARPAVVVGERDGPLGAGLDLESFDRRARARVDHAEGHGGFRLIGEDHAVVAGARLHAVRARALPEAELALPLRLARLERVALADLEAAQREGAARLDLRDARGPEAEEALRARAARGAHLEAVALVARNARDRAGDHRARPELPAQPAHLDAGFLGHALDGEVGMVVAAHDEAPRTAGELVDAEAPVGVAHRRGLARAEHEDARAVVELVAHDLRAAHAASVGVDDLSGEDRAAHHRHGLELDARRRHGHARLVVGREALGLDAEVQRPGLDGLEAEASVGVGLGALALEPGELALGLHVEREARVGRDRHARARDRRPEAIDHASAHAGRVALRLGRLRRSVLARSLDRRARGLGAGRGRALARVRELDRRTIGRRRGCRFMGALARRAAALAAAHPEEGSAGEERGEEQQGKGQSIAHGGSRFGDGTGRTAH